VSFEQKAVMIEFYGNDEARAASATLAINGTTRHYFVLVSGGLLRDEIVKVAPEDAEDTDLDATHRQLKIYRRVNGVDRVLNTTHLFSNIDALIFYSPTPDGGMQEIYKGVITNVAVIT
jgi:hypothetical protein